MLICILPAKVVKFISVGKPFLPRTYFNKPLSTYRPLLNYQSIIKLH